MKTRKNNISPLALAALTVFALGTPAALGQATYTWTQTAGGAQSWTTAANWNTDPNVPDPIAGDTVDFSTVNIANDTTLTLGADRTAEVWKFGDTDNNKNWIVATGNKMILAGTTPTIQVNTSGRTTTLNNVLDGTAGFTKTGAGTLALNNAVVNTFTGPITLNGGTLSVASLNTLGSGGNITFTGSATISPPHSVNTTFAKGVTVNPGVTATFYMISQFYNMSFTGPLEGSGTAYLLGPGGGAAGSLKFTSDSNTFTGTLQISSQGNGSVPLTVNSLADSTNPIKFTGTSWPGDFILNTGTVTPLLFNSRQIELGGTTQGANIRNNNATATNTITINTDLLVSANGNKTLTLGGSNTGANTFGGVIGNGVDPISAVISLTKADAGKWILTGANTYTGNTTISGGTLEIGGSGQLGGGSYAGNVSIASGQLLVNSTASQTLSGVISGPGALVKDNSGSLTLTNSTSSYTGNTTVTAGTLSLGDGTNHGDLNDFSTVSVASEATLNLNYTGSDFVLNLNLGGSPAAAGEWGSVGSGAANESSLITGTGRVINGAGVLQKYFLWDGTAADIGTDGNTASAGGSGTWNTTILNWDIGATAHAAWGNTSSDTAILAGAAGTVTLGADMNIGTLQINPANAGGTGYFIGDAAEDNTLTFGGSKIITVTATGTNTNQDATIRAGIAGSPTLNIAARATNSVNSFSLLPTSNVTMALGTVNMLNTFASNKRLILGGESTGNVADAVTWPVTSNQLMLTKAGTGSWTINNNVNIDDGRLYVEQGTLTLGGTSNFFSHKVGVGTVRESSFTASGTASKLVAKGTFTIADNREFFYVQNLGTISPGPGVETLNVTWSANSSTAAANGAFNMQTGSTYEWDVASNTSTDVINVTTGGSNNGNLILGDITIKINDAGVTTAIATSDQLPVFTYETGTQTVARSIGTVTIDTSALGAGWSGTPSLVDNGAGTIYVTGLAFAAGPSTPFQTWANGTFANGTLTDKTANGDDDTDLLTNLREFAFGTDPTVNFTGVMEYVNGGAVTTHGQPVLLPEGGTYYAVFGRRADYVAAGLTYTVQFSADLSSPWVASAVAPTTLATDGVIDAVSVPFPGLIDTDSGPQKARFFRVEVSLAP
jgi:autotransporter-associated beta strand protein